MFMTEHTVGVLFRIGRVKLCVCIYMFICLLFWGNRYVSANIEFHFYYNNVCLWIMLPVLRQSFENYKIICKVIIVLLQRLINSGFVGISKLLYQSPTKLRMSLLNSISSHQARIQFADAIIGVLSNSGYTQSYPLNVLSVGTKRGDVNRHNVWNSPSRNVWTWGKGNQANFPCIIIFAFIKMI